MEESRPTETVVPAGPSGPTIRIFASGSEIGSRYEVRRVLGSGGSAVVYAAFDRTLKREVALKVLRSDRLSEVSLKRFRREAAVARDAQSPRLVRVFDIGEAGEAVFLTMELVEGESLRARLERTRLSVDEAIRIGGEVLLALDVLHRLGVVHRDVKPGNVLLTPGGDVKLTDFGLARHWEGDESRATETEGLVGTIDYLAPEQALGQDVDARTDLYSAGVLLFELLAGEPPLRGGSKLGTIVAHLRQKAPDVRTRRPDVPAWLAAFVARLLEKDPSRRYPTAAAAVADLRAGRVKRRQARRWLLAGAGLLASVAILWDHWTPRREALPTLETDGRLLRAVDSRGRTLWRRDDVLRERTAWIRRARGAGPVLAAIVGSGADLTLEARHTLSFLDSLSGRALGSLTFSSDAPRSFPGFSDHYGVCPLVTHDVDGDGLDEVFVTYAHDPYWPSYTVVCDPSRGLSRTLLVASGHHRVLGFADVDGDGREEALIAGINNRMGWFVGLAAVPVSSFSGSPGRATADAVTTPDRPDFGATLAAGGGWYALTAPGVRPALEVDRARRSIRVRSSAERVTELGFDGFPVAVSSRLTPSARAAARIEAYSRLVEERRLEGAGNTPEALREAGMARDAAARADDPPLLEWASRCEAVLLVRSERLQDAELRFEEIIANSAAPADVAFDAAQSLHLEGHLDQAVVWYRRCLATTPGPTRGGPEVALDLVLALGERGRWSEARSTYSGSGDPGTGGHRPSLRLYVAWRTGSTVADLEEIERSTNEDEPRYWALEARRARSQEPPGALLAAVRARLPLASTGQALFRSLEAELLSDLGRFDEALAVAGSAWEESYRGAATDVALRAHLDLVGERYAALLRRAGRGSEARAITAEIDAWMKANRGG